MRRLSPLPRLLAVCLVLALTATACSDDGAEPIAIDAIVSTFDGETVNLSEFIGVPFVVNFFAKSCPPCVAEMPMFEAVSQDIEAVRFIGVSEDINVNDAESIIRTTGITYPTLWDRDGTALSKFESFGLPATIFVDADGYIIESHTGVLNEAQLRSKIADLLAA